MSCNSSQRPQTASSAVPEQSMDLYQELFEEAPVAYHEIDTEGRVARVNRTELRMFGYPREEMLGQHVWEFFVEKEVSRQAVLARLAGHTPSEDTVERHFRCKDGTELPVLIETRVLHSANGKVKGLRSALQDITDRKANEQLILDLNQQLAIRANELEALNKELEAFCYSVSHDLLAPLRYIDGFSDLLVKHATPMLDEKGRHYVDTINESAKRMGALIENLLVFSRMGRTKMNQELIDMDALLQEAIAQCQQQHPDRKPQWLVRPLPPAHGDRALLLQVLWNLLSNAIKYSRPRDPAIIEIGSNNDCPGDNIYFVRDNGVGFDMAYSHKLFGVFERLHSAKEFEGTGIGLANVQRIISRHGGRVWAEAELDHGATFFFALPVRKQSLENQPTHSP